MSNFKDFMSQELREQLDGGAVNHDARYIAPDLERMIQEFHKGKRIGERCHIDGLERYFSWMRGFQYVLTGHPNSGKTTLALFKMLVKVIRDGWKFQLWSPEMLDSYRLPNGKTKITGADIYDELAFMLIGENIYEHYVQKYKMTKVTEEKYRGALEWIKDHFYLVQPEDNKYQSLIDTYLYFYEKFGTNGLLGDPFKNLILPSGDRADVVLHQVFADFKLIALDTDSVIYWIAHPKSDKSYRQQDGSFRYPTEFDLAGGSAWFNSMDWIGSYHRPNTHQDFSDPMGELHIRKVRKQQLVGLRGTMDDIEFSFKTNRFYFRNTCPVDGSELHSPQGFISLKDYSEPQNS